MFQRTLLYLGAGGYIVLGITMLTGPEVWYVSTPGVVETGGYNAHFIVDIGFAFLVSGGAVATGVWLRRRSVILAGLAWPVCHAGFHVVGLAMHGAPSPQAFWSDTLLVILPALLLLVLALRAPMSGLGAGMARLIHAGLRKFEAQWNYDATYLHRLIELTPDASGFLASLQALSGVRHRAPSALLHGASLAASLHEDCGPCAQITIDMILADGGDPERLRALVRRDFDTADPLSVLGFRYVEAALTGRIEAEAMQDEIAERFGEASLAELALAALVSRTYPTLKKLTGHGAVCQALDVDGQRETVAAA